MARIANGGSCDGQTSKFIKIELTMDQIGHPSLKSLWPLLMVESVLLLAVGILFYDGVNVWFSISVTWLAFGLFCYIIILRLFPPTPLIRDTVDTTPSSEQEGRSTSIRDLPLIILILVPTAVVAPGLLAMILLYKIKRSQ
jgi:hypothetical protein